MGFGAGVRRAADNRLVMIMMRAWSVYSVKHQASVCDSLLPTTAITVHGFRKLSMMTVLPLC